MTGTAPHDRDDDPPEGGAGPRARKAYLLRVPADLLDAWRRIAAQELRSLNAQLELELREALRRRGVRPAAAPPTAIGPDEAAGGGATC